MLEDDGALAAEMLVQGNSIGRASQEASEPMLAVLYWRPSQIFAVDLKKVEGTQDYARVVAMVNSNTARPLSSQAMASPSIKQERPGSAATAAAASGTRLVKSFPLRVISRTPAPSRRAMIRNPSCLIS